MLKFLITALLLIIANIASAQEVPSQYEGILAEKNFNFDVVSILRGVLGVAVLLFIAWLFSTNRKAISWNTVIKGIIIQFVIALSVMFVAPVQDFFNFFGACFVAVLDWTKAGSEFLFGSFVDVSKFGFVFAFQILPTIIFFSALTSLLFYLGIIQKIVWVFAWLMSRAMKLSGAESLSTVANIFVGQTEAPLIVKPYISKMTRSEIMLVMTAGMSTMAGGVLAAYIGMLGNGVPELEVQFARHLLAASVMAAPGAVVISKILVPQTEKVEMDAEVSKEKIGNNVLDAISNGTFDGLKLAGNVAAMLLVFYALIAGVNNIISLLGSFDLISWVALSFGVVIGSEVYSFIYKTNKSWSKYVFWISGALVVLGLLNTYLTSRYNFMAIFPQFIQALFIGALIGSLISFTHRRNNKISAIKYYEISFGALALIFIAISLFFSFSDTVNSVIAQVTDNKYTELSMQLILGYVFSPIIWLIGVATQDVPLVGQLLGQKLILTEFVGYSELSNMLATNAFFSPKSAIMATYVLCGFANFASIGIQIGGIGSIAPTQKSTLSAFGMRSLLGGTLSALVSAAFVGMLL